MVTQGCFQVVEYFSREDLIFFFFKLLCGKEAPSLIGGYVLFSLEAESLNPAESLCLNVEEKVGLRTVL